MAQLTIDDIIKIGDISVPLSANYEGDGDLYGKRLATTDPLTIALVTDALRWQWQSFPDIPEVRATATMTITDVSNSLESTIEVFINDPNLGLISLGSYTMQPSDTTTTIAATNIANALNSNVYGFSASSSNNVVTIVAAENLGSSINGYNIIYTIVDPTLLIAENNDYLITENSYYLTTEQ